MSFNSDLPKKAQDVIYSQKTSRAVATLKSEVWEQNCVWLFYDFHFERNYDVLKSNSLEMERNRKWKIPHTQRRTLCFSSYKNPKLKVKL